LVEYSPQVTQLQSVIETLPTECAGSTYPSPVALDQSGNIWGITPFRPQITGEVGASLLEFNTSGTLISGCVEAAALTLGDVTSIAVDGSNRIWLSNLTSTEVNGGIYSAGGSIVAFANSGQPITPATGYANNGSFYPSGISIDSSGNVWVGNEMPTPIPGTVNSANVVEFVGMATPVQTPLASGLAIGKIAPEP
jgi:hypothetical protein